MEKKFRSDSNIVSWCHYYYSCFVDSAILLYLDCFIVLVYIFIVKGIAEDLSEF